MTVAELINLLEGFPPDHRVVIRGYEDGVDDVGAARLVLLKLNVFDDWYYGDHDERPDGDTPAVKLSRA